MSIKLRKQSVAQAIEDVAARQSSQSGSYDGPRTIDDAPARAVIDLTRYREPVKPQLIQTSGTLPGGVDLFIDVLNGEIETSDFTSNPDRELFGFVRWMRLKCLNPSGNTNNYSIRIRPETGFEAGSVRFTSQLYRRVISAGGARLVQYGYDATDQDGPQDVVIPPSDFVMPPFSRMIFEIKNGTGEDVIYDLTGYSYLFNETEVII